MNILLYIDPGTGSMLFSILIGIAGVFVFAARTLWIRIKFAASGGRSGAVDKNKMPIVIFAESKRYWTVFHSVCDEFEKRGTEVHYLTSSPDDPSLSQNYKHVHPKFIGEGNKAISRMNLISADIVLSTTPSLDVFQWKRSKNVSCYVHLPHMANDITTYRMFGLDFYDAVLVSGKFQEEQIRMLEKLRELPAKDIAVAGIPYMDDMLERVRGNAAVSPDNNPPVILLAPSWGRSSILNVYGEEFIDKLIETGYKIVIRPHPQSFESEKELMDRLQGKYPESGRLSWNRDPDNFDILKEADILISDFSGVLFDFSLVFDKPVIYADTEFDKEPYDAAWLDDDLWTFKILPEIGRELNRDNFSQIGDIINECLGGNHAESLAAGRDKARHECWANIGHGAEKIVDYVIEKKNSLN